MNAERIPWHKAVGRTLIDTGHQITGVRNTDDYGPEFTCEDGDLSVQWVDWVPVPADGLVPVEVRP